MTVRSALSAAAFLLAAVTAGALVGAVGPLLTAQESKGGPVFAQLSSLQTQVPDGKNPLLVKMESNDAVSGIDHDPKAKTEHITVKAPGVYFIMAAAQVGREDGTSDDHVDLWVKVNGKDVDNSNTRQTIKDGKFTAVLVCQGIAECKAGDVINVAASSSSPGKGLGLVALTPRGEPAIPSIILSMYKIN